MKRRIFALSALASSGLAIAQKTKFNLSAPYATPSSNNRPQGVGKPDGAQLSLPAGFSIEEFATGDFSRPRIMLHGPSPEIILTDSVANGSVMILSKDGLPVSRNCDRRFALGDQALRRGSAVAIYLPRTHNRGYR